MLTKQDIEAIGKSVEEKLKIEVAPLKTSIENLKERMSDLEDVTKDQGSDISSSIMRLRLELGEESKKLGRRIREVKETLDEFVDHFDEYLQKTRKKVAEIEEYLKLHST